MSDDSGETRIEAAPTSDGTVVELGEDERAPAEPGIGPRLAELAILFSAIIGAVALGLGISDYLTEHPYALGYLLAYAGFRIADDLLLAGSETRHDRETRLPRWERELPILLLFAAAPFERTYLYGGEPPGVVAAFGLLMELVGLWIAIGARIQLRFGAIDGKLVRSGLYRYVRHPARAGTLLVLMGWPLEYGAPIVAVLTLVGYLSASSRRIREEEADLRARFGDEYASYISETDRMIPNIW